MDDDFYLPRYLDEPERMIIWTTQEFIWISICAMGGLLLKQAVGMLIGLVFSLAILKLLNNIKSKYGKKYLSFWCYWHFPPVNRAGKIFPPSHVRKWFI